MQISQDSLTICDSICPNINLAKWNLYDRFFFLEKCSTYYDARYDSSECLIRLSGGCSDSNGTTELGTLFPEPYKCDLGIYSSYTNAFLKLSEVRYCGLINTFSKTYVWPVCCAPSTCVYCNYIYQTCFIQWIQCVPLNRDEF